MSHLHNTKLCLQQNDVLFERCYLFGYTSEQRDRVPRGDTLAPLHSILAPLHSSRRDEADASLALAAAAHYYHTLPRRRRHSDIMVCVCVQLLVIAPEHPPRQHFLQSTSFITSRRADPLLYTQHTKPAPLIFPLYSCRQFH